MKRLIVFLLVISPLSFVLAQDEWGDIRWDNGIKAENPKEGYRVKFGGRFMLDGMAARATGDPVPGGLTDPVSGVEFRRLWIYSAGEIYQNVRYKFQIDLSSDKIRLKDAYIGLKDIPIAGNLQLGHFKEPVGLEMLTSSNYITFMERALTNPFTPDRKTGAMVYRNWAGKRGAFFLGYFFPSDLNGTYLGGRYRITSRLTWLPLYRTENGFRLIHLGISFSHRYENSGNFQLKSRPESHLLPSLVLAEIDRTRLNRQAGTEAAAVFGRWSLQGEYIFSDVFTAENSNMANDRYHMKSYYVYASCFLTGEHRTYSTGSASFSRVKPVKKFGDGGAGAFEVALRYSGIDLNDHDLQGGVMHNITLGFNWYLNPAVRIMTNWLLASLEPQGAVTIGQIRFQYNF
ncbi:MAG: hypothetical protein Kow00127_22840 [Bacteroidales bacterium]